MNDKLFFCFIIFILNNKGYEYAKIHILYQNLHPRFFFNIVIKLDYRKKLNTYDDNNRIFIMVLL